MKRIGFRGRLFLILLMFAAIPSIVLTLAWGGTGRLLLPLVGSTAAWDTTAATGARALSVARERGPLSEDERAALEAHEGTLRENQLRSKQAGYVFERAAAAATLFALVAFALLLVIGSRVAGHLSRSLSRPLQELVGWTERISQGQPIPESTEARGAPEFGVLRARMRQMAGDLEQGRRAALEAERLSALRETARQVAHELKNPLTPIRFAVDRLRRDAPAHLQESIEVLAIESRRLEELARSFAQFGRLPEGPSAPVDLGELARYTARSSVPPEVPLEIAVGENVPLIDGHHDALSRALSNVMLNAVEACRDGGSIAVDVSRVARPEGAGGGDVVELTVRDTGCGISDSHLARIWEPYVTHKPGGTGLGLAIARQTIQAHHGAVSAESQSGRGTTIRFIFPVSAAAPHTNPSTS
ncbi:MAG: ATP-binding protein [Gemmatimonadaceae bacterium]